MGEKLIPAHIQRKLPPDLLNFVRLVIDNDSNSNGDVPDNIRNAAIKLAQTNSIMMRGIYGGEIIDYMAKNEIIDPEKRNEVKEDFNRRLEK
jgi:hypothetical protein